MELPHAGFVALPMAACRRTSYGVGDRPTPVMKPNQIRGMLFGLVGLVATDTLRAASRDPGLNSEQVAVGVRIAGQPGEQRLREFLNRPVRNVAGTTIGTVEDFLVDRTSGRLAFAVVAIPNAPLHERRRVLRGDALGWQQEAASFEVEGVAGPPADESGTLLQNPAFLSVNSLPGQTVRSGNRIIGRITDVVVNLTTRTVAPVLTPQAAVMRTLRSFVIPLSRVRVGLAAIDPVTTTVTPEELARVDVAAAPSELEGSLPTSPIRGASGISQSSVTGQTGFSTPQTVTAATTGATDAGVVAESFKRTGRTRAEASHPDPLARAEQSVRRALVDTSPAAAASVEVFGENGKLVLRGSVPSVAVRNQLEQAASAAAGGVAIESRLSVRTPVR